MQGFVISHQITKCFTLFNVQIDVERIKLCLVANVPVNLEGNTFTSYIQQFYLYRAFNKKHCQKAALQKSGCRFEQVARKNFLRHHEHDTWTHKETCHLLGGIITHYTTVNCKDKQK